MSGRTLTIKAVGQMLGLVLPEVGKRAPCPIRKHVKRPGQRSFGVFQLEDGEKWKCFSCDPPDNVGDPVKLYALLTGRTSSSEDRKKVWRELRDKGWDVPGLDAPRFARGRDRPNMGPRQAVAPQPQGPPPVTGQVPKKILPLDLAKWEAWRALDTGALRRFAPLRGLSYEAIRALDVIDMPQGFIGFTYRTPETGKPCRVKVRAVQEKKFFVTPRPTKPGDGKALAPLYLAHQLRPSIEPGVVDPVILVEGEVDALSLASVGIPNVVSLPDGAGSANAVDLSPLHGVFSVWLIATDDDPQGDQAAAHLVHRAYACGAQGLRVHWKRSDGFEVSSYKDANEALLAGFTREDFMVCLDKPYFDRFEEHFWRQTA